MKNVVYTLAMVVILCAWTTRGQPGPRTDIPALITAAGYPVEEHHVTTQDGFTLVMQRIPKPGAPVVFLQHGLVDSAATWLINEPYESLGFILSDAGYDVFLGNVRGNGQSWQGPSGCDYSDDCFWDWSWDQMAKYDLPAMVEGVCEITGYSSIGYVGHSQGTMMIFAGLENNPSLADKISVAAALAPVARVYHVDLGPFKLIADIPDSILYDTLGKKDFNADPATIKKLLPHFCQVEEKLCNEVVCLIAGCESNDLNSTRFDVLFEYFPNPTSVQDMVHFAQGVRHETFQMYDYGSAAANNAHYNATTPPLYSLPSFSGRVGLFSGGKDRLADPTDVAWLASQLPPGSIVDKKEYPDLGHGDFVWGLSAHTSVYPDVLALLAKFPPQK